MLNRRGFIRAQVGVACAGLLPGAVVSAERYGIKGQLAPELDVDWWIDARGAPSSFEIAKARGKWIYLKCFQNWCPGCHEYGFPALKKVADAFSGSDRVVAAAVQTVFEGFGVNTQESVRNLQVRYQLAIPMGHDPGTHDTYPSTMRLYRTGGTPWVIIISPEGRVVFNHFHVEAEKSIAFFRAQIA